MQRDFITLNHQDLFPFELFFPNHERESSQFLETNEAYLVTIDIPGVNNSDIDLSIQENKLIVVADRKNPFDKEGKSDYQYRKSLLLPKNIDFDKINAHYENGVLNLTIPKLSEQITKKKIEVSNGPRPKSWTNFLSFKKNEESNVALN